MYSLYWLINERQNKTYVGMTDNLERRLKEHRDGRIKSTEGFGLFAHSVLEQVQTLTKAREREKYWKSAVGRRKLRKLFNKSVIMASSSNG